MDTSRPTQETTFCSKCGRKKLEFAEFFDVHGEPYCEECVATLEEKLQAAANPSGSRTGHFLYSVESVAAASFFGSPVAGGWLMSTNYRRLGKPRAARNVLVWSAVGTLAVVGAAVFGEMVIVVPPPLAKLLRYVPPLIGTATMYFLADRFQRAAIEQHFKMGGELYSTWRAVGFGVLAGAAVIMVFVGLVVALVLLQ